MLLTSVSVCCRGVSEELNPLWENQAPACWRCFLKHRSCVTPEQLRVPYIEKETPQDQRKILLSLVTPPLASFPEVGYVLGAERAECAERARQRAAAGSEPQILEISSLSDESAAGRQAGRSTSLNHVWVTDLLPRLRICTTSNRHGWLQTKQTDSSVRADSPGRCRSSLCFIDQLSATNSLEKNGYEKLLFVLYKFC